MGKNIIKVVTSFFQSGRLHCAANYTLIALIPKVPNPTYVTQFRPISLCNVVYKIITKLLVSKIKLPLLHKLVSPCQFAFIPNRWIVENEVIVQEMLHNFRQRKIKEGMMAIKLDFQKAYDRVNWNFLEAVLLKFGFMEVFVKWIMECVSTVSFLLLINRGTFEYFNPSKGLRQGDPLSPYLFILCQDVLSRM